MPKSKKRPTDDAITDALKAAYGQYNSAAKILGVTVPTLRGWLKPEHVALHEQFYEDTTDIAEQQQSAMVRRGDPRAVEFWLKFRGRERGWSEKQDITVNANVRTEDVAKRRAAIVSVLAKAAVGTDNRGESVHPAHAERAAGAVPE